MNYRIVTLKETRSLFGQRKFLALPRKFYPGPAKSNRATSGSRTTAEQ